MTETVVDRPRGLVLSSATLLAVINLLATSDTPTYQALYEQTEKTNLDRASLLKIAALALACADAI